MTIIPEPFCRSLVAQKRLDPPDSGILSKVSMDVVSRGIPTELRPLRSGRKPNILDCPVTGTGWWVIPDVVIEKLNFTNISQLGSQEIIQLFFIGNLFSRFLSMRCRFH